MERRKSLSALGLREGASDDDIKKAFKQLALKYHPDKNQETGAKEKFQEVNRAYQYLTKGNTHFEDEDEIIIPFDLLLAMFGMRHRATPFGFPFGFSPFHHYDDNHGFCGDPRFFDSSEEEDDYFYYSGQRATNQSQRKPPSKPWSNVPKAEPKEETKTSKKKKNKSTRKKARAAAAEERKSESPGPGEKRPPSRTPKADPAKPGPQSVPPEATCRNEDVSGSSSTDNQKTEDKGGNKASQATLNQQSQQNNTVIQQPQKKKTKKQLLAEQNRREKEMATMTADLQKAQTEKAEKEQLRQEERRVREEKERIAEEKRQQELQEEEERKMEEKRRLEELRRLEEQRRLEEIRQAEERRRLEEEKRLAEKQRKEEERRLAQIEEQRCLHEQMVLEEERICREQRFAESQRKLRAQLSSKEHVNEENVSPHPSLPAASPLMKKMFKVPGQEGEELLHEVKKDARISALPKGFQAGVYNPYVDDWGDVMPDETPAPKLGTRASNQPLPASQKSWGEQMDELDDLDDLGGVTGSHQPLRPLSNAGWTTAGRNGHVKATPGRQPRPGYSSLVPQSHREEEEMLEQAKYASAQASNAQSPVNNRFLDMDDIDDITIPVPENIENTNPRGKINHFSGAKPKTGSWHSNVKIPATNSTRLTAASYTLNTQNSSTERQSNWMNNGYGGTGSKFERRPVQPLNQTSGFNGPVLSNGGHYQKNMTQPVSSDSANKSQQQAYGNVRNHQMLHGARNAYGHPQSNYQRTVPHWGDSREFEPIRRPTHATRFSQPSPWQPNVPSLNQPQMFYNSAYSIPPPSTLQPMYTYRHF